MVDNFYAVILCNLGPKASWPAAVLFQISKPMCCKAADNLAQNHMDRRTNQDLSSTAYSGTLTEASLGSSSPPGASAGREQLGVRGDRASSTGVPDSRLLG